MNVLNATSEGALVYVLLDDERILMHELDDKNCAEIHAKQVMDLKLTPDFLMRVLGFKEAEGL